MNTEAELRALLREIGPRWAEDINAHRDQVLRAYTPLQAAHPLPGLQIERAIPYGAHARHVLDVYLPPGTAAAAPRPIAVFVHGGAFVRGQMNANEQVYGNVLRFFARHGFVGVNVEYRLAPEAPFPGGAEDVAAALRHVQAHAAGWGGDATRILLIGHSAGGAHVATLLCDPRLQAQRPAVAAAVLISARLRADLRADNPNAGGVRAYFGDEAARLEADSPVQHAQHLSVPTLLAVAEHENPWLDVYAAEFCHRVGQAQGRIPRLICVPEHNHTSIVAHLDSGGADSAFGEQLLAFAQLLRPPIPS
ncbi:alpha/beta hydrolase [Paucibacter sediminis]|uniref:Alpha/beta hydrolase n=1 Tax=Paucibacter sediminis TaxID=3019553 RepID=A0AA95NK97_9BURK|nr:alpha/beta hydrolase [Paucibacter sp. S2-9]WIT14339.1 alpha/beta hydrolase [Paucibacter sp. S2-9]